MRVLHSITLVFNIYKIKKKLSIVSLVTLVAESDYLLSFLYLKVITYCHFDS